MVLPRLAHTQLDIPSVLCRKNVAILQNITRQGSIDVFEQNWTMPNPKQIYRQAKYVASNLKSKQSNNLSLHELQFQLSPSFFRVQLNITKYGGSTIIHSILHLCVILIVKLGKIQKDT